MLLTTFICDGENCQQKLIVLGCENLPSILRGYCWNEDTREFPAVKHYCHSCYPQVAAEIDEGERINDL